MAQPTCEDRIESHLAGRVEQMRDLTQREQSDDDDEREAAMAESDTLPLSVDVVRVVKVLLSTGGPADWFEITLDADGEAARIEYVFQDWFDVARRDVVGEDFDKVETWILNVTGNFDLLP